MTDALYEPNLAPAGAARAVSAARDEAFARLYERWHASLLGYSRRHFGPRDAEEITQETFARAFELLDLSREGRRQWAWLTVVARNIAADLGRHRRICDVLCEEQAVYAASTAPELERPLLDKECLQILRLALSDLPQSQSRAWWLTIAEGMTPQAIASSLACSPVSVRQALFKSRRKLALALADYCERVQALAIPAFLGIRRAFGHARRHAGRSAANAGLGATLASSALVGALAVIVQSMPAPQDTPAIAAVADSQQTQAARELPAHSAARVITVRGTSHGSTPPAAASAVKTNVYFAKKPLAPGTQVTGELDVVTPVGTIHYSGSVWRGAGQGLLCDRTSVVQCH